MKKFAVGFLAFAVWIITNLSCGWLVGGYNWDVTFLRSYTLDEASTETAKRIDKPLSFKLFVSDKLASYSVDSYNYAAYITEILSRYQKLNPQNIRLEIIRTKAWSPEAKQAENAGIKAVQYDGIPVYFGLQAGDGNRFEHIAELIPERRPYLENDINRILRRFITKEQDTVGIVSSEIPLFAEGNKNKLWSLIDELAADYKLINVSEKAPYIPQEIKVLLVLNPNKLPPLFVYALDQYLMRGGNLVVFVDPYSEIDHFYRGYPPQSHSNITWLLKEWGIVYDNNKIVGSSGGALKIAGGLHYPLWFFASGQGYGRLHFRTPGSLAVDAKDGLNYNILVSSPADAGIIDTSLLRYASKKDAVEHFKGLNQSYNLAVKVSGDFVSGYTQGWFDGTEYEKDIPPFVFVSQPGASLTVVADSDFVSDDAWAVSGDVENPFFGTEPYADNAEFILRLIDNLITEGKGDAFPVAYPKHDDDSTIVQHIAEPLITASEYQRNELMAQHNELNRQIAEIKDLMFGADSGSSLQYRRRIKELEKKGKTCTEQLDYLKHMLNSQTENAINRLLWLNLIAYPLTLILVIFVICSLLRHVYLRRSK